MQRARHDPAAAVEQHGQPGLTGAEQGRPVRVVVVDHRRGTEAPGDVELAGAGEPDRAGAGVAGALEEQRAHPAGRGGEHDVVGGDPRMVQDAGDGIPGKDSPARIEVSSTCTPAASTAMRSWPAAGSGSGRS